MIRSLFITGLAFALVTGVALALLTGCISPGATELPPVEAGVMAAATEGGRPEEATYAKLSLRGVRGGRLRFELPGSVDEVVAMLLDFDHAAGHRPWAKKYRMLSRSSEGVVAEWAFNGKLGIEPTVRIEFAVERRKGGAVVRFHLTRTAFGVAAFFGDYRLAPLKGEPRKVQVTARVYIDSGLLFVNASHDDIAKGLREDARQMAEWMQVRLATSREN
ncbi:MAG: SRPBCC family protein [Myxococcota bacterium]